MERRHAWRVAILACWSASVRAATFSRADAVATIEELQPLVEREAGRKLDHLPAVEFSDGELMDNRIRYMLSRKLMAAGMPEMEATTAAATWEKPSEGMLALYIWGSDTIYVKWQAIRDSLAKADIASDMLRPLMRCTLAHELTHALQDQVLGGVELQVDRAPEWYLTQRVMREGHAALVQARVCADGDARAANTLMDYMQGIDVLPNRMVDSTGGLLETVAFYGIGRVWLAGVQQQGGVDAIWQALEEPPSSDEIGPAVASMVNPAWTDAGFLVEPIEDRVRFSNLAVERHSTSPMEIVPILQALPISVGFAPRAHAGLSAFLDGGSRAVLAIAWEMASEAEATDFIERRADVVRRADGHGYVAPHLEPSTSVLSRVTKQVVRRLDDGARHGLWIKFRRFEDLPVLEAWLADGPLVVGVVVDGVKLSRAEVMALLSEIVDRAPSGVGTFAELVGGGVAGGRRVSSGDPRALIQRAVQLSRIGDSDGCMVAAEGAVDAGMTLDFRREASALGYTCAIEAGDPQSMRRWSEVASAQGSVEVRTSIAHAASLAAVERHREAVAVLDRAIAEATDEESRKVLMSARDRGYRPVEQQHYRTPPLWWEGRAGGVTRRGHAVTAGAEVWLDYGFRPRLHLGLALGGSLPAALEVRPTDRSHPLVTGAVSFGFWLKAGSTGAWRIGAVVGAEGRDYLRSVSGPFLVPTLGADFARSLRIGHRAAVEPFVRPTYDFRPVEVHYDGRNVKDMTEFSLLAGVGLTLRGHGGASDDR